MLCRVAGKNTFTLFGSEAGFGDQLSEKNNDFGKDPHKGKSCGGVLKSCSMFLMIKGLRENLS